MLALVTNVYSEKNGSYFDRVLNEIIVLGQYTFLAYLVFPRPRRNNKFELKKDD